MFHIYELHRKTKQIEEMFVSTANLTGDYNEASAEVAIMLINLSANESVERHLYQILSVNESMKKIKMQYCLRFKNKDVIYAAWILHTRAELSDISCILKSQYLIFE